MEDMEYMEDMELRIPCNKGRVTNPSDGGMVSPRGVVQRCPTVPAGVQESRQ